MIDTKYSSEAVLKVFGLIEDVYRYSDDRYKYNAEDDFESVKGIVYEKLSLSWDSTEEEEGVLDDLEFEDVFPNGFQLD